MINEKTRNGITLCKYASLRGVDGFDECDIKTVYDFMRDGGYNTRMVTDFESAVEQAEEDGNKKLVELLNAVLDFMTKHNLSFLTI